MKGKDWENGKISYEKREREIKTEKNVIGKGREEIWNNGKKRRKTIKSTREDN